MKFLDVPQAGSWAGVTHQRSRAGQVRRNRRAPVQSAGGPRKGLIRTRVGFLSSKWRTLSDAQRLTWANVSAAITGTDGLGQAFKFSSMQCYMKVNLNLLNAGAAVLNSGNLPVAADMVSITAFSSSSSGGSVTLSFSGTGASYDYILVALSPCVSAGVSHAPWFYQFGVAAGNATSLSGLSTAFGLRFGAPRSLSRLFCKLTTVNSFGFAGVPIIGSCVVT